MKRFKNVGVVVVGVLFFALLTSRASATTGRQLNRVLPEVNMAGIAFADAIDFVRDVSGANIVVNWKALEGAGVSRDVPVNIRLRSISLRKALDLILTQAGGGDKLGFTLDQGVVEVTTRELVDQRLYTRVYPVDDLIMDIPDFTDAPDFSLNSTSNNTAQNPSAQGGVAAGGGGGGNLFNGNGSGSSGGKEFKTKNERAQNLIDLIEHIVKPDVWRDNGGNSVIRFFNGSLIVTAPRSVQEAIGGSWD